MDSYTPIVMMVRSIAQSLCPAVLLTIQSVLLIGIVALAPIGYVCC